MRERIGGGDGGEEAFVDGVDGQAQNGGVFGEVEVGD